MEHESIVDNVLTCPITLESIEPSNVFYHAGHAFDIFALYTYLTKTVNYVNPINRVPFTIEDLESLERKIQDLCGTDSVMYDEPEPEAEAEAEPESKTNEIEPVIMIEDSLRPLEVEVRNHSLDNRIQLEVNVNLDDSDDESTEEVEDNDSDGFDDVSTQMLTNEDLPPRRCFPSIVQMAQNKQYQARTRADLDLLQYLSYDSMDVLNQMVTLLSDDDFHRMVWEQTSPTVLQALTRIVGLQQQQEQDNIDVEVTFTSCWEAYRRRLLRVLKARYHEIVLDMRRVDLCEACVYVRSHIADVQTKENLTEERKTWLREMMEELL